MGARTLLIGAALIVSIGLGTVADRSTPAVRRSISGYHVLAVDFHVHSFPQTWSTLSPFETVVEARRHGLDAIAMTPHNQVWGGRVGRWFADLTGGPIVIPGQEITTPGFHMLAIGITETIPNIYPALRTIDEIHRQGGVAIAAHPYRNTWPAYDATSLTALDGAEVVRPEAMQNDDMADQLRQFFERAPLTAIGSSDFHGWGDIGFARTFVFAFERSAKGIVDAVRAGRTLVYDRGRIYGHPVLQELMRNTSLESPIPKWPRANLASLASRVLGVLALVGVLMTRRLSKLAP